MGSVRKLETAAPFLIAAHAIALVGGFGSGAVLAGGVAGWWGIGPWWAAVAQAHGAAQLWGWGALWVLGVGAVLLPKLCGVSAPRPGPLAGAAALVFTGLLMRWLVQAIQASAEIPGWPARAALAASGLLLLGGVTWGASVLGRCMQGVPSLRDRPRLWKVLPLVAPAFVCLLLGTLSMAALSVHAASAGEVLLHPRGHRAASHLVLMGFLLPAALGFGALLVPPFFRWGLVASKHLRWLALLLFPAVLVGAGAELAGATGPGRVAGAAVGVLLIAYLGLLVWSATHPPPSLWPPGHAPPTRRFAYDRGEYGRFELLVASAWIWLAVGAVVLVVGGPADAARHAIGVGFLTSLIAAMALRLVPRLLGGEVRWRGVAWPLFGVANLAAAGRVLPMLWPGLPGRALLLGLSGLAGLSIVVLLAVHLVHAFASGRDRTQGLRVPVGLGGATPPAGGGSEERHDACNSCT
jgi:hypothetical protein